MRFNDRVDEYALSSNTKLSVDIQVEAVEGGYSKPSDVRLTGHRLKCKFIDSLLTT